MTADGAGPTSRRQRARSFWIRHRSRWTLPLVIIVVIIVVATVDRLGSQRISEVDATSDSQLVAVQGGSVSVDLPDAWDGFNPNTPAGAASSTPALLVSVLPSAFVTNSTLIPTLNSDLLTSVEVQSTTPLTIEYVINPKAKWSDGVPFTAADFAYAWQSQRGTGMDVDGQPDQVASTLGYQDVRSVTGSNHGRTVTVVFSTPYSDWRMLFHEMVPAHIAEKVGWSAGFATFDPSRVLSAGPMLLQSVTDTGHALLVRNPSWWGAKASVDQVDVTTTTSGSGLTSLLAGSSTAVAQPAEFDLSSMNDVSSLPNTQSVVKPSLDVLQLAFNVSATTTSDVHVREAIAHLVNRQALLQASFGTIDPSLTVSDDHLAVPSQTSYAASTAATSYDNPDASAADRLLQAAGYHEDAAGRYVDATGKPLTVRLAVETGVGDPWSSEVGAEVAAQLQQAGITTTVTPVEGPTGLANALGTDAYDVALVTHAASQFPTVTQTWYSAVQGPNGPGGSQNWSNFDDPQVDQLFSEAAHGIKELNPVVAAGEYAQIDDLLWDQMVALPLFQEPALVAYGVQIENVTYDPSTDGIMWNLPLWSVMKVGPKGSSS